MTSSRCRRGGDNEELNAADSDELGSEESVKRRNTGQRTTQGTKKQRDHGIVRVRARKIAIRVLESAAGRSHKHVGLRTATTGP